MSSFHRSFYQAFLLFSLKVFFWEIQIGKSDLTGKYNVSNLLTDEGEMHEKWSLILKVVINFKMVIFGVSADIEILSLQHLTAVWSAIGEITLT